MIDVVTVRELIERAIKLSRCYAIWWELVNKKNFDRYEAPIKNHEDFFATTSHALFQCFAVTVYQLFERRKDTKSIPAVIEVLRRTNPALAQQLSTEIELHKPVLAKLFAIRNKVYAHRSKLETPEAIFAKLGLTPTEMNKVVAFVRSLISSLAEVAGETDVQEDFQLREDCSREDTQIILKAIEKHVL